MDQSDDLYLQDEDIGEIFQDEENMAALLLYKQGNSEEYNMVSQVSPTLFWWIDAKNLIKNSW